MNLPEKVELIEVCPRDGFQNVHDIIPFDAKVAIIKKLAEAGFKRVEAVSFVSPKAIPQMADAKDVMLAVKDTLKEHGVRSVALVPNARGVETALECGVDELTYVVSVSEKHNMANVRRTPAESLEQFKGLIGQYGDKMSFRLAYEPQFPFPPPVGSGHRAGLPLRRGDPHRAGGGNGPVRSGPGLQGGHDRRYRGYVQPQAHL